MIQELINWTTQVSSGNQILAGVVLASVSGSLLYLARVVPAKLKTIVQAQFVTTVVIDTTTWNKRRAYANLLRYIASKATDAGTRSLSYDVDGHWNSNEAEFISIGFGWHFFFYRYTPLVAYRARLERSGGELYEYIRLYKFGRKHKLFHDLLMDFTPKKSNKIAIKTFTKDGWVTSSEMSTDSGLDSIALDQEIRVLFESEFKAFKEKRDVHLRLGIAHKLAYVLHGLPGSGKTSLIRALACEYAMNICILDVCALSDSDLHRAFSTVPKNTIILAEDFDSAKQLHSRVGQVKKSEGDENFTMGTLKGMLNALDGIQALDEVVVMFTTNHLEKIDNALVRSARIDHVRQLPQPGIEAIKNHFITLYPELSDMSVRWGNIPGCIIYSIKQRALDSATKACELINFYVDNPEKALMEQLGRIEEMEEAKQLWANVSTVE